MNLGVCLYCEEEKELKRSHAIGNTIFRKILKNCEKNAALRICRSENNLRLDNDSWATYQLCSSCEQYFNEKYENYSINALRGKREEVKITNLSNGISYSNIDVKKIACYFLSIYWRGAHSKHQSYENLKITDNIDLFLRQIFKGESEIHKFINIKICTLYDDAGVLKRSEVQDIIVSPFATEYSRSKISFSFIFEGYLVEIFIGKLGFFEKKERGFLDIKKRIIVMPDKDIFELDKVVEAFQHGKNLHDKKHFN